MPKSTIFLRLLKDFGISFFSAFRRPKTAQEAPNIAPRAPKRLPRWPHDGPGNPQDGPKKAPSRPKRPPRRPRWPPRPLLPTQDGLNMASKMAKMASKTPPDGPRRLPRRPKKVQHASKLAQEASPPNGLRRPKEPSGSLDKPLGSLSFEPQRLFHKGRGWR